MDGWFVSFHKTNYSRPFDAMGAHGDPTYLVRLDYRILRRFKEISALRPEIMVARRFSHCFPDISVHTAYEILTAPKPAVILSRWQLLRLHPRPPRLLVRLSVPSLRSAVPHLPTSCCS